MTGCSVVNCHSNSYKRKQDGTKVRFFRIPKKPLHLRQLWLEKINRLDFEPSKNSMVCEEHFVEKQPTVVYPVPCLNMGYETSIYKSEWKIRNVNPHAAKRSTSSRSPRSSVNGNDGMPLNGKEERSRRKGSSVDNINATSHSRMSKLEHNNQPSTEHLLSSQNLLERALFSNIDSVSPENGNSSQDIWALSSSQPENSTVLSQGMKMTSLLRSKVTVSQKDGDTVLISTPSSSNPAKRVILNKSGLTSPCESNLSMVSDESDKTSISDANFSILSNSNIFGAMPSSISPKASYNLQSPNSSSNLFTFLGSTNKGTYFLQSEPGRNKETTFNHSNKSPDKNNESSKEITHNCLNKTSNNVKRNCKKLCYTRERLLQKDRPTDPQTEANESDDEDQYMTPTQIIEAQNRKITQLQNKLQEMEKLLQKRPRFGIEHLKESDAKIRFYTGFPTYADFKNIFEKVLEPKVQKLSMNNKARRESWDIKFSKKPGPKRAIELIDEFLLTMMKLRLDLVEEDLAYRFGVHQTTVSRTLSQWLPVLSTFNNLIQMPAKEQIPQSIKEMKKGTTTIRLTINTKVMDKLVKGLPVDSDDNTGPNAPVEAPIDTQYPHQSDLTIDENNICRTLSEAEHYTSDLQTTDSSMIREQMDLFFTGESLVT